MTLRLSVDTDAWKQRVAAAAEAYDGAVIAVVKGNGYGFGSNALIALADELVAPATDVAVGTAHELRRLAPGGESPGGRRRVHVLVPAANPTALAALGTSRAGGERVVATVGSPADAERLAGWDGSATVKLRSSMRRFGVEVDEVGPTLAALGTAAIDLDGFAVHLPLAGSSPEHAGEIDAWLRELDGLVASDAPRRLSLSHVSSEDFAELRHRWPDWELQVRIGSQLWHGDKMALHLTADVVAVTALRSGDRAGYHAAVRRTDGWLVVVGAGSAHGIATLDDGRSPFHHQRRRVELFERPHMHTSMLFVPADAPAVPVIGETVDVQRPLINVAVDETVWR